MNQKMTVMNPNINLKNQLAKPTSSRNNPSIDIISNQNSSKNRAQLNQNCPKLSIRAINTNQNQIEENQLKNQQPKITQNLKNKPEVFTRLSSNKGINKAGRKPSEDLVSENSYKYLNKPPNQRFQTLESSRDKSAKQFPSQPVQNMQKLLSLGLVKKLNNLKHQNNNQNLLVENRKQPINIKNLVEKIKLNQKRDEKSAENVSNKANQILGHSATTTSTLHALIRAKKLKTDYLDQNSDNQNDEKLNKLENWKSNKEEIKSFDQSDNKYDDKNTLICEEKINPTLKRCHVKDKTSNFSDFNSEKNQNYNSIENNRIKTKSRISFHHETFNNSFEPSTILYLIEQEELYSPNPHYIDQCQPSLKWKMRSILLDWMQEVCSDYLLKRETFYYAVNFVDRYLSIVPNVEKKTLQLIGLTSLYLAAKIEEVLLPKVENMVLAANNTYTAAQIIKMENTLYFTLSFRITPPTLNTWANWFVSQWDLFVDEAEYAQNNPLFECSPYPIKFKLPTQQSYTLYRNLMQVLDASILEIQTLQYRQRALILSIMYVLIGREIGIFNTKMIVNDFIDSSQYLLDNSNEFNNLFGRFVLDCFGVQLPNLLPTIQYVSSFFSLDFDISLPIAAKIDKENVLQVTLLGKF